MGRIKMAFFERISQYTENKKTSRKKLCLSIVSLVLAATVLISATFCWYALSQAEAEGNGLKLEVGQGLRVNDLGDTMKSISDRSYLLPASSVDGRNLYFPADGLDFKNQTKDMTFRSANAGDRNYSYVQYDFNLTAEANYTGIYLDKDTSLKINIPDDATEAYATACKQAQKAIRAAIYYEKMDNPVVFNAQNNPSSVNAVKEVDRTTGRFIESKTQVAYPFRDYFYGNRQLAVLNQGETRPFSLIIWLEGTSEDCVSSAVMLKQLVLKLKFTTNWDNSTTIKFKDKTGTPVYTYLNNNPGKSLVLNYSNSDKKITDMKFTMYKSKNFITEDPNENNYTWYCHVPGDAFNDLEFQIIDDATKNVICSWNETPNGASTVNRGTADTYYVDSFSGSGNAYTGKGHWHDGNVDDQGYGHDIGEFDDDDW